MNLFNLFKHTPAPTPAEQPKTTKEPAPTEPSASKCSKPSEPKSLDNPGKSDAPIARVVHNLIILDESGSMGSIYRPAFNGVNETLQTIRQAEIDNPEQTHTVTLVTFNTNRYNRIYDNTPAAEATDLDQDQFKPYGGTPLFDAMGRAINELHPKVAQGDVVLVTVITDGEENSSREYIGRSIKALIEHTKAKGWIYTFIGANQDVERVAASLSIPSFLSFEADEEGTTTMFEKERRSRRGLFGKLKSRSDFDALNEEYFQE